jgi:MFS family permease
MEAEISVTHQLQRESPPTSGETNGKAPSGVVGAPSAPVASPIRIDATDAAPAKIPPRLNRVYVTGALLIVMVLAAMELTVTSTAMPTIIGDLHGLEHYSWVTSVYLLVCTITMPIYGRLADALGRKRVLLFAIAVFGGASVLAASAHSLLQLIIFRGFQGLGAGGIMPVVLTILGDIFTLEERAAIQGVFSAVWGGAALAGPAIGALLVDTLGWRSIFFVNLPFGALGFFVLVWQYHDHEKPHSTDLDLPGVLALAVACAALLPVINGLITVAAVDACLVVVAIAAIVWFIRVERRAKNPIMPPDLVMERAIGPALLLSALMGIAFFGVDTYVPLFVQGTTGAGAKAAAGVVTPVMLSWAASGIVVAPIIIRWGFRRTALVGSCFTTVSFIGLVTCAVLHASGWVLAAVLMLSGLGFGAVSMSCLLSAQHHVSWQQRGIVTSGVQFVRTMGGAIGIGLLGMLFNVLTAPQMQRLREMGVSPASFMDPDKRQTLPPAAQEILPAMFGHGLTWVFVAMAVSAILQFLIAWMLPPFERPAADEKTDAFEAFAG